MFFNLERMTRTQETVESYDAAFDIAQQNYKGQIDETDHSGLILPGDTESFDTERRMGEKKAMDAFKPIDIHLGSLAATEALYVNRPLLVANMLPGLGSVYSPAVITKKFDHHPVAGQAATAEYYITKLMQPFVPKVGVTSGIHLGISLASQSRAGRFGGHGENNVASGFEQGHFLATAIGAHDATIGQKIIADGHTASGEVINDGVIDRMSGGQMLGIAKQRTQKLNTVGDRVLRLYWHEALEPGGVPIFGDYQDAIRLATGGAMLALGETGQERVKTLIDDAVKEKKTKVHDGSSHAH